MFIRIGRSLLGGERGHPPAISSIVFLFLLFIINLFLSSYCVLQVESTTLWVGSLNTNHFRFMYVVFYCMKLRMSWRWWVLLWVLLWIPIRIVWNRNSRGSLNCWYIIWRDRRRYYHNYFVVIILSSLVFIEIRWWISWAEVSFVLPLGLKILCGWDFWSFIISVLKTW